MKCVTWSTNAAHPHPLRVLMRLHLPFYSRFHRTSTRYTQTTNSTWRGEPPAALPQRYLLETHFWKDDFVSIKLPRFTLKEESPHLSCLGRHRQQIQIISSTPFSSAMDAILLISFLGAKWTSQRYWGLFSPHNITVPKEQRRKKGSFSNVWFSSRNFPSEAQNNLVFSPFWKGASLISAYFQTSLAFQFCKTSECPFQDVETFYISFV